MNMDLYICVGIIEDCVNYFIYFRLDLDFTCFRSGFGWLF